MNCRQAQKLFIFRIENELTAQLRDDFDRHISECNGCSVLFSQLSRIYSAQEFQKRKNPNPFLFERIEAKINDIQASGTASKPAFAFILKPIGIAVIVVISFFIGLIIARSGYTGKGEQVTPSGELTMIAEYFEIGTSPADSLENYYVSK